MASIFEISDKIDEVISTLQYLNLHEEAIEKVINDLLDIQYLLDNEPQH